MRRSVRSTPRAAGRRAGLALETLEGREVPAGNVTASLSPTGLLTLVGDNASNAVTLQVTGTTVTVTGNLGTTVNGFFPLVSATGTVRAVQAAMNGGDDVLRIDPTANFLVPGAVNVNLGQGNNTLSLQTAGRLALGSLNVVAGAGNDTFAVAGGLGRGSGISGFAALGTAAGNNSVTLRRMTFANAVSVATGIGADTLNIDASTFLSGFFATMGAGNDAIRIAQQVGAGAPVDFRQPVLIHADAGNDTLLLGRAVVAGGDVNTRVIFRGGTIAGDASGTLNHFDTITAQRTGQVTLLGWA